MIAVASRQHRVQLSCGVALMVVLGALLLLTGEQMTSYLRSTGFSACLAAHAGACDTFSHLFENRYGGLLRNVAYLNFLPMLVGVFWGAPLVARELETGTFKLAWTQSVTRRRWLAVKLTLFVVCAAAISTVFSLLLGWWLHPFAELQFGNGFSRMDLNSFDFQGVVPIGYSVFAFAAGAAAGVIVRRVLPAMAITFAIYLPLRIWVQGTARPLRGTAAADLPCPRHQPAGGSRRLGDQQPDHRPSRPRGERSDRLCELRRRAGGPQGERVVLPGRSRLPPDRPLPARLALLDLPGNRVRDLRHARADPAGDHLLLGDPPLHELSNEPRTRDGLQPVLAARIASAGRIARDDRRQRFADGMRRRFQ
jgi:hypothetical protein